MTLKFNASIPFQSRVKGKCLTCGDKKTLDGMVRKDYYKGMYHCIDCKVELENMMMLTSKIKEIKVLENPHVTLFPIINKIETLQRFFTWAMG